MSDIITLTEVLDVLKDNPGPHSVSYTKLDMNRKTGGQYVTLRKVTLLKHCDTLAEENKAFTLDAKQRAHKPISTNHAEHLILLFKDLEKPARNVIEIHGRLISRFNGKQMRYGK